uniref:Uncharacterized protein n=1 Tax=Arundo donax TaxID=35708 RepID=A0A0A9ES19_ARUDO
MAYLHPLHRGWQMCYHDTINLISAVPFPLVLGGRRRRTWLGPIGRGRRRAAGRRTSPRTRGA